VDTPKKFFGTIDQVFRWGFELGRSTPPLELPSVQSPAVPPAGLYFWSRPRGRIGWWNQTSSSQISITLVGLEARAVTKSETEAERLRAHARRSRELARAIADQEASRALKAYAAELLERADCFSSPSRSKPDRGPRGRLLKPPCRRSLGAGTVMEESAKLNQLVNGGMHEKTQKIWVFIEGQKVG
jgi:hypothetical protein